MCLCTIRLVCMLCRNTLNPPKKVKQELTYQLHVIRIRKA